MFYKMPSELNIEHHNELDWDSLETPSNQHPEEGSRVLDGVVWRNLLLLLPCLKKKVKTNVTFQELNLTFLESH